MVKVKVTTDHDRAMMLDSDNWPCWPFLPVKRRNNSLENKNLGILLASDEARWTVYHVYMFDMPKDLTTASASIYNSVDEVLADGWEVD